MKPSAGKDKNETDIPVRDERLSFPRKRVLFVGEGVTLAHVARPLELARQMDPARYDVIMACDRRYETLVRKASLTYVPIRTISPDQFAKRVNSGKALYTRSEMASYVREDMNLIARTKPDVIVSDFRLSLGISADVAEIPWLTISNLHWSPSAHLPVPMPEHPAVKLTGVRMARYIINKLAPYLFGVQARAFNQVRKEYGLPPVLGRGAHEVYTLGTRTLYADIPELYGIGPLAAHETCLGPINWAPDMPLPAWWNRLPEDRPVVLFCPGSSGRVRRMKSMVEALAESGASVIVITAGKFRMTSVSDRVFVADFISAPLAVRRADVVVCNGGSAMVYQALAAGKPILGIPNNMDQHYSMEAVERSGAGRLIRAGQANERSVREQTYELLRNPAYRMAAESLRKCMAQYDPTRRLDKVICEMMLPTPRVTAERALPLRSRLPSRPWIAIGAT